MSEWLLPRLALASLGLLALVTSCAPVLVAADDSTHSIDGIYLGTIAGQQVVVAISWARGSEPGTNYDEPGDWNTYPISGHYFYRRHGVDIQMAGMPLKDGSLRIREYRKRGFSPEEFTAEWRVRVSGDRAVGVFCKCDLSGSAKPTRPIRKITLRRISRELPPPQRWERYKPHSGNLYYDLLLDFPDKTGPEIEVNQTIAYRMRTDPRYGVSRPEVTRLPSARIRSRINAALDAEYNAARLRAQSCLAAGRMGGVYGGFYNETVTVSILPPDVLGILVLFGYYSGGAHPNEGNYTLNYSLHTSESFTLEDSFRASGDAPPKVDVAALLARLYRRHYVKPDWPGAPEDCDVVLRRNTWGWDDLRDSFSPGNATLSISEKGLVIIPIFRNRMEEFCARPITVPYRELRRYVKKDSLLGRVVDQAKR